ncbi:hypothetical protein GCM10025859_14580 [Alicyclobacillus fastidiosus]|nr:hypothetical protein GCM10025859_14580 [Alicyclobacillus fastidiosus]
MRKATQLIAIARNSVGDVCALEEDKWELQYLLDAYERVLTHKPRPVYAYSVRTPFYVLSQPSLGQNDE